MRRQTQLQVYSALSAEPAVAASVLNTSMPESTMNRLAAERMAKQGYMRGQMLRQAGLAGQDDPAYSSAADLIKQRNGEPTGQDHDNWFGKIGKFLVGATEGIGHVLGTGLSWIGNVMEAPAAAGAASGSQWSEGFTNWVHAHEGNEFAGWLGGFASLPVGAAQGITNWVKGAHIIGDAGGAADSISDQQRQFMQEAGYDPNSWTDRYKFYYNDHWGSGRQAIADSQIRRAQDEGLPQDDIDSAREYLLSGAADATATGMFNDKLAGLSKRTQDWVNRLNSEGATPQDRRIFNILSDDNALQPGATIAKSMGAVEGTKPFAVATAVGDLALEWYADPLAASGSAVKAVRTARYGVRADELGRVPALIAASDTEGRALHRTGQAIDDALVTADSIHLLRQAGTPEDLAQAARLREGFERLHPDMRQFMDASLSTRSGEVSSWMPREGAAATREAKRAVGYERDFAPMAAKAGTGKPAWELGRETADASIDQAKLAEVRAKFADDMITGIVSEAFTQGRPLFRGKILLPGSVTMGAKLRAAAAPIFNALGRQDEALYRAIRAVDADKSAVANVGDAADNAAEWTLQNNQWLTNLPDKGFGIPAMVRRGQQVWERSFSGAKLTFHDQAGTETMRRFVAQFMPRRQAYAFINEWSSRSPAGRVAMYQELMTSMVESTGMRGNGQVGRKMAEYLTRGMVSDGNDTLSGQQALGRIFHNYAAPERNTILAEGRDHAAGLFPYQMSDGVVLPSYGQMKMAMGRTVLANRVLGLSGRHFDGAGLYNGLRSVTSAWKAGKTGTFGNMQRQILEGGFLQAVIDPATLPEVLRIRRGQAIDRAGSRMVQNEAVRGARGLTNHPDWSAEDIAELQRLQQNDTAGFRKLLIDQGKNAGLSDDQARMMALLSENVDDIHALAAAPKKLLFAAAPIDFIRKQRLAVAQKTGRYSSDSDWGKWVDENTLKETLAAYEGHMTSAHQGGLLLRPGESLDPTNNPNIAVEDAKAAASVGLPGYMVKLPGPRPANTWQQVSTAGDVGALKMAEHLDRLHNDEIAGPLMRYLAHQHETIPREHAELDASLLKQYRQTARKTDKTAGNLRQELRTAKAKLEGARRDPNAAEGLVADRQAEVDRINDLLTGHVEQIAQRQLEDTQRVIEPTRSFNGRIMQEGKDPLDPDKIQNAEDYARHLLTNNEAMRTNSWRLLYDGDGKFIKPDDIAGREAAIAKTAKDQLAEIRHILGIRDEGAPGEILPMLRKIADGHPPSARDLRKIPDELRPPEVAYHTFIPDVGAKSKFDAGQKLAEYSTRYYDMFVGKPMARLWTLPLFQAELDQGYRLLEPFAESLVEKGMSREAAGQYLLHTSAKYATAKVFNTTDNVSERSMFAELADNWFMFSRATENFFHRFGKAATYNPGTLARMWLAAEAAQVSGVVYKKPVDSEQGNQTEWYFTYPGSAMMARFTNDIMRGLGFGDAGVQQPVFAGSESPVKWLNPALTNPLGITANPMFGNSLRIFRAMAPNTWAPDINQAIFAFEGGEQFFSSQSALKAMLPSNLYRLTEAVVPAVGLAAGQEWDPTGKLASNTMFAMRVAAGAGLLPGPDASAQERQDAVRSMRIAAHNALVWRTLFGLFGPAVALQDGFETAGPKSLPTPNEVARKNGINSITNEFWQILNDASDHYGSDSGFTIAMEEWARRHPQGALIYNPNAFTVGSSQFAGDGADDIKSIPRTMQMVQFVKDNPELVNKYSTLFPFLLPAVSDGFFDTEANRLMYEMGILERKDVGHFYNQVVNAGFINDWWKMEKTHQAGAMTDDEWYQFDADWRQLYPMAAQEKDRRSDPDYVHQVLGGELKSFLSQPQLPPDIEPMRDQIQELYDDYADYRREYLEAAPKDRYFVNSDYREAGNRKWLKTPMNDLWKAFAVYEGNR